VLEWKIKYNKYKMLSAPAKCARCSQKTVKQAYTFMCQPCAEAAKVSIVSNIAKLNKYMPTI